MRIIVFLFIFLMSSPVYCATYYLDASSGNDSTGDGSEGSPWQTLSKAQSSVSSGDIVYLQSGDYGSYSEADVTRTSYVTYQSVDGATAHFDTISITNTSLTNTYLKFIGINLQPDWVDPCTGGQTGCSDPQYADSTLTTYSKTLNPVGIANANYVIIQDCTIEGQSEHLTSVGILLEDSSNVTIQGNDVSAVTRPIQIESCADTTVTGNHLHNMCASGINMATIGSSGTLIENNYIHDATYETTEDYAPRAAGQNYHGSGVAIHGGDITIRGNIIHNGGFPSAGIMAYDDDVGGTYHHDNVTIENNLIYDIESTYVVRMYKVGDNVVIRNNTFVGYKRTDGGAEYRYNTGFGIDSFDTDGSPSVDFYNNIVIGIASLDFTQVTEDNNILWSYIYGANDFYCDGDANVGTDTYVYTCAYSDDPSADLSTLFPNDANLTFETSHGLSLDLTIDTNSPAYNAGDSTNQPTDSLGSLSNNFVQDDGPERSASAHSAGAYEYAVQSAALGTGFFGAGF